jgi:soluble cytochrome b562
MEKIMFWVTETNINEFAEYSKLTLDESKKVLEVSSGSMEEIKEKWTAHSKQHKKEVKAEKKELKQLIAVQDSIPRLVEEGKLGEAILAQNELIELYRVRGANLALKAVTRIGRNFGIG